MDFRVHNAASQLAVHRLPFTAGFDFYLNFAKYRRVSNSGSNLSHIGAEEDKLIFRPFFEEIGPIYRCTSNPDRPGNLGEKEGFAKILSASFTVQILFICLETIRSSQVNNNNNYCYCATAMTVSLGELRLGATGVSDFVTFHFLHYKQKTAALTSLSSVSKHFAPFTVLSIYFCCLQEGGFKYLSLNYFDFQIYCLNLHHQ